jgi:hypothetical protein
MSVFVKAGRADLAEGMGSQLKAQAQVLLSLADEKTKMGDIKGAVQTLQEALHLSPGHMQVMLALASAILKQLGDLGWDHPLAEVCHTQIETIRKLDPDHPLLGVLAEDYQGLKRKYGISN